MAKDGNGSGRGDDPRRTTVVEELRRRGIAIAGGAAPFAYRRGQLLLRREDLDAAHRVKEFAEGLEGEPEPLEAAGGAVVRARVGEERQVRDALRRHQVRAQLNHVFFTD